MFRFQPYQTVIDTKRQQVVTVMTSIGPTQLYVVQREDGDYYITDVDALIEYDKYYFDREKG